MSRERGAVTAPRRSREGAYPLAQARHEVDADLADADLDVRLARTDRAMLPGTQRRSAYPCRADALPEVER
jgi:hypothetical protein